MCERYVIPGQDEVEREFRVAHPWWTFATSFNVSPARNVPVIRLYDGETEGVMLRWGLIPEWAEGDASKGCAAHIPAEAIGASQIARGAWSRAQRCILPAFGFYVWQLTPERYRQPWFVRVVNRPVFGVAALWDRTVRDDDDDVIESCAMLTVPSNPLLADSMSARMPAILRREDYDAWLRGAPEAGSLLRTYPHEQMVAHAVSPRINSLKYDDGGLIESVEQRERNCA